MINAFIQIAIYLVVLISLAKLLSSHIVRVYEGSKCGLSFLLAPMERLIYRCGGVAQDQEMDWKRYAVAVLLFNFAGLLLVYLLQRAQVFLPLNTEVLGAVKPDLAFNTAVSFITNTNWQAYSGENMLSYFTQMSALAVQNFVSAATGMAVLFALIRGITRRETDKLGNFWVDLVRGTLYILLPLATILAVLLVSQGVVQSFSPYQKVTIPHSSAYLAGKTATMTANTIEQPRVQLSQTLPMGLAASQVAIKQLGANGGGFFGTNSAHPYENPTPLSNFLEMLALLLIPMSLCFVYGVMVKDKRQGRAIFIVMTALFIIFLALIYYAEQTGSSLFGALSLDQHAHSGLLSAPGGNMEGKETRFGIVNSALWTTVTTSVSNGSVNSMLDSFTPLGGLVPMVLMQFGEVVYGGVGSGLYGMLAFIILTVFVVGLMVGRTPEYLGKKIESFEMKMACLIILVPNLIILLFSAIAVSTHAGTASVFNAGAHGFSEILYTLTSTSHNNGSSFAGLNSNTPFYNVLTGLAMLMSRFWIIFLVLAMAGSLAGKKILPVNSGTMPTHTPLFIGLLVCVILIFGALTFFPALALGPIVEHLTMISG